MRATFRHLVLIIIYILLQIIVFLITFQLVNLIPGSSVSLDIGRPSLSTIPLPFDFKFILTLAITIIISIILFSILVRIIVSKQTFFQSRVYHRIIIIGEAALFIGLGLVIITTLNTAVRNRKLGSIDADRMSLSLQGIERVCISLNCRYEDRNGNVVVPDFEDPNAPIYLWDYKREDTVSLYLPAAINGYILVTGYSVLNAVIATIVELLIKLLSWIFKKPSRQTILLNQ